MSLFDKLGASYASLVLRLGVGGVFLMHGTGKLQMGVRGVAGFFGGLGIPLPTISAAIVITVETLGAICLILGLFSRVWAACMAVEMVVAIVTANMPGGKNFELEALLLTGALALVVLGDGTLSVGSRIRRSKRT